MTAEMALDRAPRRAHRRSLPSWRATLCVTAAAAPLRSARSNLPLQGNSLFRGQKTRRGLEIIVQDRPRHPGRVTCIGGERRLAGRDAIQGDPPRRLSGAGLGVGLSSAQRLADEFTIDSIVGSGTRVRALKWDSPGPADDRSEGRRLVPAPKKAGPPPFCRGAVSRRS